MGHWVRSMLKRLTRRASDKDLAYLHDRHIPRVLRERTGTSPGDEWRIIDRVIAGTRVRFLTRPGIWDTGIMDEVVYGYFLDHYQTVLADHPAPTILDVGGHIGGFSVALACLLPKATVHTFEVMPDNVALARINVMLNGLHDRVHIHHCGLGAAPDTAWVGRTWIRDAEVNTGGMSIAADHTREKKDDHVPVPVRSTSEVLAELGQVDLMKLDCEGSEYPILDALAPEDFARIERMVGEVHLRSSPRTWQEAGQAFAGWLEPHFGEVLFDGPLDESNGYCRMFVAEPSGSTWDPWSNAAQPDLRATWRRPGAGAGA